MISDDELYRIAIFLGSISVILIILYHFIEVNATVEDGTLNEKQAANKAATNPASKQSTTER